MVCVKGAMLLARQGSQDGIERAIKISRKIFDKESQDEIAILLQRAIFMAVAPIGVTRKGKVCCVLLQKASLKPSAYSIRMFTKEEQWVCFVYPAAAI